MHFGHFRRVGTIVGTAGVRISEALECSWPFSESGRLRSKAFGSVGVQLGHYPGTVETDQFLQDFQCNLITLAMLDTIVMLAGAI